ncbi:hypothetical protein NQ318_017526 [Aromia moschata]|uniref:LNS2/PITP domain-containing protein n=1 Tax=Aromia moschata TaxID=1265417 RepID=A0AAV8Z046_9CUCU|nr:hypothetical protein NQ318_017526 [Aromia moschata]
MDCESGNGPSLTQSPNSGECCKSIDSDFEEQTKLAQSYSQDISLSLCGWEPEPTCDKFLEHLVKFSDLCNSPILFENPNLVVRIKDKYYTWKVAAPIITSIMVFGRPLLQVSRIILVHRPLSTSATYTCPSRNLRTWRKARSSRRRQSTRGGIGGAAGCRGRLPPAPDSTVETDKTAEAKDVVVKEIEEEVEVKTNVPGSEAISMQADVKDVSNASLLPLTSGSDKCRKTLRLSSKQILSLNLRDGMNEVEFSVTTAYQGTTRCQCHLYKWKWDDKIVISDIDGTITKSDVLGHILPIVGKDWAQSGVAQLFNKIADNGYKLLYLSARAIGQARITREYLKSIKQGDLSMPDGPILLNPTSLITAFHREVIEKKPEQFKISCMSDIKALFPPDSNPFYAGYGNRINDVWAYRAVGIPIVRIFTINPKGELKHELTQTFQSSYSGQSMVVNDVFPPLLDKIRKSLLDVDYDDDSDSESSYIDYTNMSVIVDQLYPSRLEAANDYSQNIFWRDPIPTIEELPEMA